MQDRDGMRAADADRQAVADRLRLAVDEGRLDLHEYDERLQRAYTAKTYGELDALLADLPAGGPALAVPDGTALAAPGGPPAAVPGGPAGTPAVGGRPVTARWVIEVWEPWLKVVPIVVAIWAVASLLAWDLSYFWPGWVAGPWGAVLLVRTVLGITSGEPARWAADRERRRQRRRAKRDRRRERRIARREGRELPGASG